MHFARVHERPVQYQEKITQFSGKFRGCDDGGMVGKRRKPAFFSAMAKR